MDVTRDRRLNELMEGVKYDTASKIGHNRVMYTQGNWEIVRYHFTDIAKLNRVTGGLFLDSGGYRTATTKKNINRACEMWGIPISVYQEKQKWYIETPTGTYLFEDGFGYSLAPSMFD